MILPDPQDPIFIMWHFLGIFVNVWITNTLYLFPSAVVTNCSKLGSLKQQRFILLQFWNSEV